MSTIRNVFKIAELRNKLLFTLGMIAIYRFGSHVPVPGISLTVIEQMAKAAEDGGMLGMLSLFSGGALTQFSVFALGIMPYITASIIMQILAVVIPKLEQWQEQGAVGQRKITQWTRYLGVSIALLQGTGITYMFHTGSFGGVAGQDIFGPGRYNTGRFLLVVLTLTAGFSLLMWIGEIISERGVGNGMSILIFASVVSTMPGSFGQVKAQRGWGVTVGVALMFVVLLVGIVFIEQGVRRIPVQFAKRQVGRRMYGGQNTFIPLKVNGAGVISVIFASSVLYLPMIIGQALPVKTTVNEAGVVIGGNWAYSVQGWMNDHLVRSTSPVYLIVYGVLIIAFAYFYTAIQFDPAKQADQIRKQGGFIPGIRPGHQTERYLAKILSRITLPGALFVAGVALIPAFVLGQVLGSDSSGGNALGFFGISILIAVGVSLETVKQIDGQLMMRNYDGFLDKAKSRAKESSKK